MSSTSVVVGYDGSEGGRVALDEALRVAGEIGGDVVVVFAYDKIVIGGELRDLDLVVKDRADRVLAEAAERAAAAGVACATRFVEGAPAHALVAAGDEHDARFIVVGSYGERPLKGVLVGSTPYKLMQLSERPLIVVRIPD